MTITNTRSELSERLGLLVEAVGAAEYRHQNERWNYVQALTMASASLLAFGLGWVQTAEAARLSNVRRAWHDPVYALHGLGDLDGRATLRQACGLWLGLARSSEAAGHREAFGTYAQHHARLMECELPAAGGPRADWLRLFGVLERADYGSGESVASILLASALNDGRVTDAELSDARAFALAALADVFDQVREVLAVAYNMTPRTAPDPPVE